MTTEELVPGEVVFLVGGPLMTVSYVCRNGKYACKWFDHDYKLHIDYFDRHELHKREGQKAR